MTFSSCALPELGRASATKVNKFTNFKYASLFSRKKERTIKAEIRKERKVGRRPSSLRLVQVYLCSN